MRSVKFAIISSVFVFIVVCFGVLPAVFLNIYRSRVDMGLSLRPIDFLPIVFIIAIIFFVIPSLIGPIKIIWKMIFSDQELREKGVDGQARILEVIQTGTQINNQPMMKLKLEVSTSNQPPYIVEDKFMVPLMGLSLIRLGAVIPVKVDPKNPKRVAINAWNINPSEKRTAQNFQGQPIMQGMPVNFQNLGVAGNVERGVVVNGKKGQARIMGFADAEKTKNGQKVYSLKYEVTGEGITPYVLDKEMPLPDVALQLIRVGAVYPCEIDNNDPTHVMIAMTGSIQKPI
ncbi:hypothetical protein A3J90_00470 [candidate division WOR-1 bacterium RIFOXYC2_FULL_37_10]|uniref:Uncharacterized protein n=1 Tax=candidate division WOR-1 bacterium RIFOXYB2_FULL_37_13 TaxID=1802579 RepID=A0A1F4SPX5_UNCSA|nr:MAG: hypothetical protein A2310_00355 [candidate division WOR-1 bacterium RIFOXYB2_FULL_37_13]OGC32604.1 MAG: hypothetical protein A3J90_00470 [candidate division WOR-1 bacterium RIFOXYC2_FULL_37_10]